jgi:hypothetical protein
MIQDVTLYTPHTARMCFAAMCTRMPPRGMAPGSLLLQAQLESFVRGSSRDMRILIVLHDNLCGPQPSQVTAPGTHHSLISAVSQRRLGGMSTQVIFQYH